MGKILWRGRRGEKIWCLGRHQPAGTDKGQSGGDMPCQHIDNVWNDDGDHTGHITDTNHTSKIIVNGDDCVSVAERIINFLNWERRI